MTQLSGLLLVDKPSGPTSHDVVDVVRRGAGLRRVGHGGTLDPLATGLLVVCLGPATRLSEYLTGKSKRYRARVRFGASSTTYDADGQLTPGAGPLPGLEGVEAAVPQFQGPLQQRPPAFSAIKRAGQKAYDLARRGETVDLEPRAVTIFELHIVDWQMPDLVLDVHCSAGTYIRSLAHDLGQVLGCGAHLAELRRTASGHFTLAEAVTLRDLEAAFAARTWLPLLRPPDAALLDWPVLTLTEAGLTAILHGQGVAFDSPRPAAGWARAYSPTGEFVAVVRADDAAGQWKPQKVLAA